MKSTGGWISWTSGPGGKSHLSPDVRAEIESREALRKKRRGRLLAGVCVRVYENDAEAQVSLPHDAPLTVESDPSEIAAVCGAGPRPGQHVAVSFARVGAGSQLFGCPAGHVARIAAAAIRG